MANSYVIGVDSARAGWVCAVLRSGSEITFNLFENVSQVHRAHRNADKILVDIPIGLASNGPRRCDKFARKQLGIRRNSVFSPPCRDAIYQKEYIAACDVNERLTGKRISKQSWNISPKIREVDDFLQSHPELTGKIMEAHPELSFALFAGHPMYKNKKTVKGFEERFRLLSKHFHGFKKSYDGARKLWHKSAVADDDLLDASVLALAALEQHWRLLPLPDPPECDIKGLPMQIVRPLLDLSLAVEL